MDSRNPKCPVTNPGALAVAVFALLLSVGVGRIILTYQTISQTSDEATHLAAGMEWLDQGTYHYEHDHPPLARVAAAILPFLDGSRSIGLPGMSSEGNAILHARNSYSRTLSLARLGILPFFLMAATFVWFWSRNLFGTPTAVLATALFTTLPPVLAHSGLGTNDMAVTATFVGAMYAFSAWVDQPSLRRTVLCGIILGLALISKLSTLVFFPACAVALIALRWTIARKAQISFPIISSDHFKSALLLCLAAFFVVWAGYRFSFEPLAPREVRPHERLDQLISSGTTAHKLAYFLVEMPIPAPEFADGVLNVFEHNKAGHASYLLGERRTMGWWYFFPIVLSVKTPLAFLVLTALGTFFIIRRTWRDENWAGAAPLVCALAVLFSTMPSHINIGVRYILPVYPFLSIVAAFGAVRLVKELRLRWVGLSATAALLGWQLMTGVVAHPDYLPYFNELVVHPDEVLVDSDLDWGQDLTRLSAALKKAGVTEIAVFLLAWTKPWHTDWQICDLSKHGLPPSRPLIPNRHTTGWIAISAWGLKVTRGYEWLEAYKPVAFVGKSIRLYHIPSSEA